MPNELYIRSQIKRIVIKFHSDCPRLHRLPNIGPGEVPPRKPDTVRYNCSQLPEALKNESFMLVVYDDGTKKMADGTILDRYRFVFNRLYEYEPMESHKFFINLCRSKAWEMREYAPEGNADPYTELHLMFSWFVPAAPTHALLKVRGE